AEDGIRAFHVTGVQTCALPILVGAGGPGGGPGDQDGSRAPAVGDAAVAGRQSTTRPGARFTDRLRTGPTSFPGDKPTGRHLPLRSEARRVGKEWSYWLFF